MPLRLRLLTQRYAVCRLASDAEQPAWPAGAFVSITRTGTELSVVCEEEYVPPEVTAERGWRCFWLEGPIPFETTGVAAAIASPLAAAGISIFLVSTFDTDYLLVKEASVEGAGAVLQANGFEVS